MSWAGDIAGISGEHELKCVHESLKHRWSVGDVGPQTGDWSLSHSGVFRALQLHEQAWNW